MLMHTLLCNVQDARSLLKQQQQKKKQAPVSLDPAIRKAQNMASNILNLSLSEVDELMTGAAGDQVSCTESQPYIHIK